MVWKLNKGGRGRKTTMSLSYLEGSVIPTSSEKMFCMAAFIVTFCRIISIMTRNASDFTDECLQH